MNVNQFFPQPYNLSFAKCRAFKHNINYTYLHNNFSIDHFKYSVAQRCQPYFVCFFHTGTSYRRLIPHEGHITNFPRDYQRKFNSGEEGKTSTTTRVTILITMSLIFIAQGAQGLVHTTHRLHTSKYYGAQ